ncbi:hypothetical protein QTN25_000395 [Entamoeba marina]
MRSVHLQTKQIKIPTKWNSSSKKKVHWQWFNDVEFEDYNDDITLRIENAYIQKISTVDVDKERIIDFKSMTQQRKDNRNKSRRIRRVLPNHMKTGVAANPIEVDDDPSTSSNKNPQQTLKTIPQKPNPNPRGSKLNFLRQITIPKRSTTQQQQINQISEQVKQPTQQIKNSQHKPMSSLYKPISCKQRIQPRAQPSQDKTNIAQSPTTQKMEIVSDGKEQNNKMMSTEEVCEILEMFNDSQEERSKKETLTARLSRIPQFNLQQVVKTTSFYSHPNSNYFSKETFYVVGKVSDETKQKCESVGGCFVNNLTPLVTIAIVCDEQQMTEQQINSCTMNGIQIVQEHWLIDCIKSNKKLSYENYSISYDVLIGDPERKRKSEFSTPTAKRSLTEFIPK